METINPNELSKLNPYIISFITLNNGKIIKLENSKLVEPNIEKKSKIESIQKTTFKISKKIIISFDGKDNIDKKLNNNLKSIKNDFNTSYKIIKNVNFSFYGKSQPNNTINNEEDFSRKILPNTFNNDIITISNKKYMNIYECSKTSNNYFSPIQNVKSQKIINNNNFEENKQEISINNDINDKIKIKSKNYKERLEKLFDDLNKPTVNAVISLDIPSDIPYHITGTQKQLNLLIRQLKRKKNRYNKKCKNNENYHRYYELYKNPNNKKYNATFNHKRLKYYEESNNNENDSHDMDLFSKNNYKKNNIKNYNSINYNGFRNSNNFIRNNNYYSVKEMNTYKSKSNTISYLFPDKGSSIRSTSERSSFMDKVNKKVKRGINAIIYPSNNYND